MHLICFISLREKSKMCIILKQRKNYLVVLNLIRDGKHD